MSHTKNLEYKITILCRNLSWDSACQMEIRLIKELGRRDLKKGRLINMTDGGEGHQNPSKETRIKSSLLNKGKVISSEVRLKISNKLKGKRPSSLTKKKMSKSHLGLKHSSRAREKMKNSCKNSKIVLDIKTGIEYRSITEAKLILTISKETIKNDKRFKIEFKN